MVSRGIADGCQQCREPDDPQGAKPIHADRGGGWLLLGFFRRLNLFALAVPVFCGNAFASSSSMMLMVFGV
jgi:hypothetical protein